MNWWVVALVLAAMLLLRWRKAGMLAWAAVWFFGLYAVLRYGFTVPVPVSVIQIYMGIVTLSLMGYVLTDRERISEFWQPIDSFVTEPRYRMLLAATVVAIPATI